MTLEYPKKPKHTPSQEAEQEVSALKKRVEDGFSWTETNVREKLEPLLEERAELYKDSMEILSAIDDNFDFELLRKNFERLQEIRGAISDGKKLLSRAKEERVTAAKGRLRKDSVAPNKRPDYRKAA